MTSALAVIFSFVWLFVNIVDVAGSCIVLVHQSGYRQASYIIDGLSYQESRRSGISWGLMGHVEGKVEQLSAPTLVDAKSLGKKGLEKAFPVGQKLPVWYNPAVTDTQFQHRSLRVLPYVPDLWASELARLGWWGKYCLLPFLFSLLLAHYQKQRRAAVALTEATTAVLAQTDEREPNHGLARKHRLLLAVVLVVTGLLPILAALDLGPLYQRDIHGPPWIGMVAGGIFLLAGVAMAFGKQDQAGQEQKNPLAMLFLFVLLAAFASLSNWIAFGGGPRQCGISMGGFGWFSSRMATDLVCRSGFGIGAVLLDGILLLMLGSGIQHLSGEGRFPRFLDKLGLALVLLALLPLLLPFLLVLIAKAVYHYLTTGRWPRNEAFIERMRKKREGR